MSLASAPRVSGYELLAEIGAGGSGSVFRARSLATGDLVALKHVVSRNEDELSRFRHEAEIQSRLQHENVLAVLDVSTRPGELFLVTELADGSVRDLLDRTPRLPVSVALFLVHEALRGLAAAQAQQVLHRDMKPHNVLLMRDGRVKVADFGVAKASHQTALTATGSVVGTPAYMSPEQALGRPLDGTSDLFSVGTMLYEMLAGGNPWLADVPANTMRRILDLALPPLGERDACIPAGVERFVDRLLAKDRFHRPASAADAVGLVAQELARLDEPPDLAGYLADPAGSALSRSRNAAARHLARARSFAAEGAVAVEIPLWEAVLAVAHEPSNEEARRLLATLSTASGYRVERRAPKAHTAEAAARLVEDPDDVTALLRLAKAAKIDRDFLRMMRLFNRLKEIPLEDPYLGGQIASLVARPGTPQAVAPASPLPAAVVAATRAVPAGPPRPAREAPAVRPDPARRAAITQPVGAAVAAGSPLRPGRPFDRAVSVLKETPHLVVGALIGLTLLLAGLVKLL